MALDNPFLQPSATRRSALRYLWSDEPTGDTAQQAMSTTGSVVDSAFNVQGLQDEATAKALNIASNGGEYNPNDTTDYRAQAQSDPVGALLAFDKYGSLAIGLLGVLGLPFSGAINAGVKQGLANNVMGLVNGFVGQYGGQAAEGKSPLAAGLSSMLPFGVGDMIGNDNVESALSLAQQFGTTGAMAGYFNAALDPTIGDITSGMIEDPTSITPAQYGTIGQAVSERVQSNVANGMSLNAAQNEAIDFFQPNAAISTAIPDQPLPTPTPIEPNFPPSFEKTGTGLIYTDPSAVGPQLPNEYIPGLFTSTPVSGGESTVATPSAPTGGYVTDGSGNYITSGDGTAVTWGTGAPSYTPTANELSFASTDGYTADVPSASAGGYDPTSGYDSDTDSGGGGGSSKIVCTAMNEAYGFGSFRNKIWLAYAAKHLSKEHEKGYHALFLPLVNIAYHKQTIASKPLRAVLENIARHRSADLRAEMRGTKRDTLGRAYRAILEPLCYFVGKYK